MRFICVILLSLVFQSAFGAEITSRDSLLNALAKSDDKNKVNIYRNLADLSYNLPEEGKYLQLTYEYARKFDLKEVQLEALSDMAIMYTDAKNIDSARLYIRKVADLVPSVEANKWLCYLYMFLYNCQLYDNPRESDVIVAERLAEIKAGGKPDTYIQMEQAYMVVASVFAQGKYDEVWPYVNTLAQLANTLPFKDGCRYQLLAMRIQARLLTYTQKYAEAIASVEEIIKRKERYVNQYCRTRPYYPMDEFYILNYTTVMMNVPILTEEQSEFYINRLIDLGYKSKVLADKYHCYYNRKIQMCSF